MKKNELEEVARYLGRVAILDLEDRWAARTQKIVRFVIHAFTSSDNEFVLIFSDGRWFWSNSLEIEWVDQP